MRVGVGCACVRHASGVGVEGSASWVPWQGGIGPFMWRIFVPRGWGGWRVLAVCEVGVSGPPRLVLSCVGTCDARGKRVRASVRARGWVYVLAPRELWPRPWEAGPGMSACAQEDAALLGWELSCVRVCVRGGCLAYRTVVWPTLTQK